MSIDPSDLIQAGPTLYEGNPANIPVPTTFIPTTTQGGVGFMVMSYPGRPQMVPMQGMPPSMSMPYMPIGGPQSLMPAVMSMPPHMIAAPPMPMSAPPIRYRPHHQAPPVRANNYPKKPAEPAGPPVTVFVGNITERAPDAMIRHILAACGHVVSWKRVQAFGFCEFGSPDAGLRAIRLLHDMDLGGKKLVVKVDAKTKTVLDEFKAEHRKKLRGQSPLQDETPDEDDYLDEAMKKTDQTTLDRIKVVLEDYESDMNNFTETRSTADRVKQAESKDRKMSRTQEKLMQLSQGGDAATRDNLILDDVEIEEGKRDLITREIGKFREIMKKQEEEKEVERRRKELIEREQDEKREAKTPSRTRSPMSGDSPSRSREDTRSPSPESIYSNKIRAKARDRSRRSHSRDRERDREREREREKERIRERERERERDRERDRDRDRDRDREDALKKSERQLHREREEEEEAKEKKKTDRRAREKEASYQERLRNWEGRERRKAKENEKERDRERTREEEREREAKRLKEFLEDYDDERDDAKYYKGRELQRRLADRKKEMDMDNRDRQKEKEELDELKLKIFSEEHADPVSEFERLRQEVEEQYKPKILIDVNLEQTRQREKEKERQREKERDRERQREAEREYERQREEHRREEEALALAKRASAEAKAVEEHRRQQSLDRMERVDRMEHDEREDEISHPHTEPIDSDEDDRRSPTPTSPPPPLEDESQMSITSSGAEEGKRKSPGVVLTWNSPQQQTPQVTAASQKKKKLDMKEVFNTDDDDDSNLGSAKKRKLVPLDYGEDKKKKEDKKEESTKSQDEKRKHIKTLIDKIPTDKTSLFAFQLDWSAVDNQLMERRIRPWINKKIIEYIGEPEPTLVDFICSKVLAGSAPQGILDDVQMVLDEEAEVFVVKMWRLLIYEIEAKKLGLVK